MFKLSSVIISLFVINLIGKVVVVNAQYGRCRNPNNRNGYCITVKDCPTIIEVLQRRPFTDSDREFVVQSQCSNGYGEPPHICCTEDTEFTNIVTTTTTKRPTTSRPITPSSGKGNILPQPPICGQESTGNRIYNGNATALDEFPWMVLLEYRTANGMRELKCGGSLINQRYVLTAAHCLVGEIERTVGQLVRVRLGEYDISKDVDCSDIINDCADPILEVGIEEIIAHEKYDEKSVHRYNDIGLIRLDRDITYTDFIRPVCLPSTLNLLKSEPGTDVVVAGWGRTLLSKSSSVKQKLFIPIYDSQKCTEKFSSIGINIMSSQICAGGVYAKDTCDGDSGGPLMKLTNSFYAIEGIVSFGNKCGLEGWPGIYTSVSSYEYWIKRNLKP